MEKEDTQNKLACFFMEQTTTNDIKGDGGKIISQQALYSKIACKSEKILQTLFGLLDSRNEAIKLGAAKILANKIIPDRKAVEVGGEGGGPIIVHVINDYISEPGVNASPTGSLEGQDKVQGSSVAPESAQN